MKFPQKNLNFLITKLQTSDAISVVSGYEEYKHIFARVEQQQVGDYKKDCTSYNSDSGSANLGAESVPQLAPGMILSSN